MAGPSRPLNPATHDIFCLENEDMKAQLQLRRPVQEKLETQYRRWQDHEQHRMSSLPFPALAHCL